MIILQRNMQVLLEERQRGQSYLSIVGDGDRREGRVRELLEAAKRGEGFDSRGEGFCPGGGQVGFCPGEGGQVGLERRGEGEPLAAGDASAS